MDMILQIFALALIMGVVWYLGYHRGKTIKERDYAEMEEPALTKEENEKREQYYEFCRMYDQMMTDDDFFSGDISKSSRTDTNKDELK
jgi:hypothetical protein